MRYFEWRLIIHWAYRRLLWYFGLSTLRVEYSKNGDRMEFHHWKPFPHHKSISCDKLLVLCHGGFGESARATSHYLREMITYGYHVVSILYDSEGLYPEGKQIDNLLDDRALVADVVEWFEANYSIKSGTTVLYGESRGGFVALNTYGLYSSLFKKCIVVVAPTDLDSWFEHIDNQVNWPKDFRSMLKLYMGYHDPILLASWMENLYLLYGGKDGIVPAEQGVALAEEVGANGLKCTLWIDPEGNHAMISHRGHQRRVINWISET